jgi:hypothetical protein
MQIISQMGRLLVLTRQSTIIELKYEQAMEIVWFNALSVFVVSSAGTLFIERVNSCLTFGIDFNGQIPIASSPGSLTFLDSTAG